LPDNTWILRPQDAPSGGFASSHDTWYFSRVAGTFKEREGFHGCQMPEQLLGRIIRISSNPGDLVVDPFAGSGTTLAVAKKLGRYWLGIELSRDYVTKIKSRINECRVSDPLEGPADPVRSAPRTSQGKKRTRFRNGRPVLRLDEETEKGIIDAYKMSCQDHSTDLVLCDPELNERFVDACKRNSLRGDASVWIPLLLRIRKAGKLPKVGRTRKRLTAEMMDPYSAASEAAMQLLRLDYGLTLDDILCSPTAAAEFDRLAAQFTAEKYAPFKYRWAAMVIRKRAKKSRALATQFEDWDKRGLRRAVPLKQYVSKKYEHPGVYLLSNQRETLYVGETLNVRGRMEQILHTESWMSFEPSSVKLIDTRDQQLQQYGLQSVLIGQMNPILNSVLLRPDHEAVA
jgi:site-specific DNA-methyltransferase (adenine-specific)